MGRRDLFIIYQHMNTKYLILLSLKKKITRVLSLSMMVQQGHDGDLADGGRISNTLINEQDISLSPWADH